MPIEHKDIADPDIHEPKGVATAASGHAYIANGVGGGSWKGIQRAEFASARCGGTTATTGVTGSFKIINSGILGSDMSWSEVTSSSGVTVNTANGYFEVAEAGTYQVTGSISMHLSAAPSVSSEYQFTVGIDSGAGVVSKELNITTFVTPISQRIASISMDCMPVLSAGDKLYLMVRRNTSTEQMILDAANLVMTRVQ